MTVTTVGEQYRFYATTKTPGVTFIFSWNTLDYFVGTEPEQIAEGNYYVRCKGYSYSIYVKARKDGYLASDLLRFTIDTSGNLTGP